MDVTLVMFKADGTRRDFPIKKPRFVVGRTTHCDLRIPLSSVSRQHCEIRIDGNRVNLRDLGSSNGTQHNSTRIQEVTLKAGDEISIGPVVFTLVIDGQPRQIQPVRTVIADESAEPSAKNAAVPPPPPPPPRGKGVPAARPEPIEAIEPVEHADQTEPAELTMHEDDELPAAIEPDERSPTVDLDDPIAALEALAKTEEQTGSDIPLLAEEDEEPPPAKP